MHSFAVAETEGFRMKNILEINEFGGVFQRDILLLHAIIERTKRIIWTKGLWSTELH